MVLEPTAVSLIVCSINMLPCKQLQFFFKDQLDSIAIERRSSNVSKSVIGLKHLTKNVSAICILSFLLIMVS